MLDMISKVVAAICAIFSTFFVSKKILRNTDKVFTFKNIILLILFVFISVAVYNVTYSPVAPLIIFLSMIIIYKVSFKLNLTRAIITVCVVFLLYFVADMMIGILISSLFGAVQMRTNPYIFMFSNFCVFLLTVLLALIPFVKTKMILFVDKVEKSKYYDKIIFFILILIVFSLILYNISVAAKFSNSYLIDVIIMFIFFALAFIFINEKNNRDKLNDEYDRLMEYVENFENWIEDEQLNRHEYKNQLAVLRTLAKEKKVKTKIDEILEDNINIKDEVVNKLKDLPKGGLKGLMYYKAAIAQKQKIKLAVDVSLKNNTILKKLSENQVRIICKLIGIYFDNAIEAAIETKKKYVILEIYELSDKVNIVFSNTFKTSNDIKKRNEKGTTTKGEGHGNGLYFANNILSKNKWLDSKQEIIDGYYIQTLSIKKLDIK